MKKNKILIIGLDGATWKIIDPLIKKGKMPFLAKIRGSSTFGNLKSKIPPITACAWVSMQTGVNPGRHGIFGFVEHRNKQNYNKMVSSDDVNNLKLWKHLRSFGKSSLVINMPVTYPARIGNGVMISSFLTPKSENPVYPKEYKKLLDKYDYQVDISIKNKYGGLPKHKMSKKESKIFLTKLKNISQKRLNIYKKLLKRRDFDLQFIMFKGTDIAQHVFYQSPELEDYYSYVDGLIKELYNTFRKSSGYDSTLMIVSDHGFHKIARYDFAVNRWLERNGFLSKKTIASKNQFNGTLVLRRIIKNKRVGNFIRNHFRELRNKLIERNEMKIKKRKHFKVTREGIYFFEDKGEEYLNRLVRKLRKVKYEKQKVFKIVERSKDLYRGRNVNKGPDIVWLTCEDFSINVSVLATEIFSRKLTHIKGDHESDVNGIYMLKGNLYKIHKNLDLDIYDVFPLACYSLGVPIPEGVDGKLPISMLRRNNEKILTEEEWVNNQIGKEINELN